MFNSPFEKCLLSIFAVVWYGGVFIGLIIGTTMLLNEPAKSEEICEVISSREQSCSWEECTGCHEGSNQHCTETCWTNYGVEWDYTVKSPAKCGDQTLTRAKADFDCSRNEDRYLDAQSYECLVDDDCQHFYWRSRFPGGVIVILAALGFGCFPLLIPLCKWCTSTQSREQSNEDQDDEGSYQGAINKEEQQKHQIVPINQAAHQIEEQEYILPQYKPEINEQLPPQYEHTI